MSNNHSNEFYIKKYNQIHDYATIKGLNFPFKNLREFKSTWEAIKADGVKNVDRAIKYGIQYNTDYKTALAEYRAIKEINPDVKLKSLKEMTTTEFANEHKDLLIQMYHTKRAEGMTGDAAGKFISTYWFGSE